MGACSSKPKTTEFEGSTEPLKGTEDVAPDRIIDAVDVPHISQQNESSKVEEGAVDADAEAVQEARELIASKNEEPSVKGLLITEEGVSHSIKAVAGAIDGEEGSNGAEKGESDAGDVPKVDVGVGAADIIELSDKATTISLGADQDKLFEDKAVVSDEACMGVGGVEDAYIDKRVAADEEKAHDSGSVTTQDEQLRNSQDISESPGAESPIIGVVQSSDPIHVDDVSESVGLATLETPAHVDSKGGKSPNVIEKDVLTGTNTGEDGVLTEEAAYPSPGLPHEEPEEKDEVLHDKSKALPSVSDERGCQDTGADPGTGEEGPLASACGQDETSVEDTTKPVVTEDAQNYIDERKSEPHEENALEERARESHAEVAENDGNAELIDQPELEAHKVIEGMDAKVATETKSLDEAIEGQDEGIVHEPNVSDVQLQTLAVEEPSADSKPEASPDDKPEASPDEAVAESSAQTEREEVEEPHIEEGATNEEKMESVDAGNLESSAKQGKSASEESDLAFEDASDLPLKVESSTVESGGIPKS